MDPRPFLQMHETKWLEVQFHFAEEQPSQTNTNGIPDDDTNIAPRLEAAGGILSVLQNKWSKL